MRGTKIGVPIFADLDIPTAPLGAIQLANRILSILSVLEENNAGVLRPSRRILVDICSDNVAYQDADR